MSDNTPPCFTPFELLKACEITPLDSHRLLSVHGK